MNGPPTDRRQRGRLRVDAALCEFVEQSVLPGIGGDPSAFWRGLDGLAHDLGPVTRRLLAKRDALQTHIDDWHRAHPGEDGSSGDYRAMLRDCGYLLPEGPPFTIDTVGVDPEIGLISGPQLVVPATNARFALNAANARWGSLYDALYGTDALGDLPTGGRFDPARGARVVSWAKRFLDSALPLDGASHADVTGYATEGGRLIARTPSGDVGMSDTRALRGTADQDGACHIAFVHNGLHIVLVIDPSTPVGSTDAAGLSDVLLESAVSTIVDLEDSVACVDAEDKVAAYTNWLGLMTGTLSETFQKAGRTVTRKLRDDLTFTAPDGTALSLPGRALLLVRNVGHLMSTPAVLDADGAEIGEGLLDAIVTVACAMHDLWRDGGPRNSPAGSVYVVKPKMHGPEEVAHAVAIFDAVEAALGLSANTVKLGIMDEERRTSANLAQCIRAARHRVAFINTGFLDRTGDEIHTSMEAGAMVRKAAMKDTAWIAAYEDRNVDIGLACGLRGRAQIGKGMWAMPDLMADMLAQKGTHPLSGASCAWVPSPTAATLHATHYHEVDVAARQAEIAAQGARATLKDLLTIPLARGANWSEDEVAADVDNNVQGILGYVVRWVDQGVGCSKVPDIHDVGLMEDRATCRISSQALANWLRHGVIDTAQAEEALRRMAAVVDRQNAGDPDYRPMAPGYDGPAFLAARDLVLRGAAQPSGYTEPLLHAWRLRAKAGNDVTPGPAS